MSNIWSNTAKHAQTPETLVTTSFAWFEPCVNHGEEQIPWIFTTDTHVMDCTQCTVQYCTSRLKSVPLMKSTSTSTVLYNQQDVRVDNTRTLVSDQATHTINNDRLKVDSRNAFCCRAYPGHLNQDMPILTYHRSCQLRMQQSYALPCIGFV